MQRRTLPKTGWSISELGVGCWPLGGQYGAVEREDALNAVRCALDLGINLFDTADAYGLEPGTSEEIVGEALGPRRDEAYIATKVGNWARRAGHPFSFTHPLHVYACCDASLHRLRTDRIDLYQCHIGSLEDPSVFLEAFENLVERGKILAYGISTNSLEVLQKFNTEGNCTICQLDYSMLNRSSEQALLPYCEQNQIGTLIRGPLAQGLLSGRYDAETTFSDTVRAKWNEGEGRNQYLQKIAEVERIKANDPDKAMLNKALQFVLEHPAVTCVIPGVKSAAQVEEQFMAVGA